MKRKIDAIIFDLTRTLIDISASQNAVIEITVNNYLQRTAVTQKEIKIVKGVIGFNNEWDTTYAIVNLIKKNIPVKFWQKEAANMLPIDRDDKVFNELYVMFQTCYLGSTLFKKLENGTPSFPYEPGLIALEKSFVSRSYIAALKLRGYKLAIATGCPKAEAYVMLKQQGLLGKAYFEEKYIVGREAAKAEKPDPAPLLETQRRLQAKNPIFIGDSISDAEASRRANIPFIFLGEQKPGIYKNSRINQIIKMFL